MIITLGTLCFGSCCLLRVFICLSNCQLEEESFNPDYMEVDRVLDMSETTMEVGKVVVHYLVKWKALPYEDATWELEDDVDIARVSRQLAACAVRYHVSTEKRLIWFTMCLFLCLDS